MPGSTLNSYELCRAVKVCRLDAPAPRRGGKRLSEKIHICVPAQKKIVSIFKPHSDIIVRGKESHPVEFGHKIWLNEVDGG
jgi:hypothetical protein